MRFTVPLTQVSLHQPPHWSPRWNQAYIVLSTMKNLDWVSMNAITIVSAQWTTMEPRGHSPMSFPHGHGNHPNPPSKASSFRKMTFRSRRLKNSCGSSRRLSKPCNKKLIHTQQPNLAGGAENYRSLISAYSISQLVSCPLFAGNLHEILDGHP